MSDSRDTSGARDAIPNVTLPPMNISNITDYAIEDETRLQPPSSNTSNVSLPSSEPSLIERLRTAIDKDALEQLFIKPKKNSPTLSRLFTSKKESKETNRNDSTMEDETGSSIDSSDASVNVSHVDAQPVFRRPKKRAFSIKFDMDSTANGTINNSDVSLGDPQSRPDVLVVKRSNRRKAPVDFTMSENVDDSVMSVEDPHSRPEVLAVQRSNRRKAPIEFSLTENVDDSDIENLEAKDCTFTVKPGMSGLGLRRSNRRKESIDFTLSITPNTSHNSQISEIAEPYNSTFTINPGTSDLAMRRSNRKKGSIDFSMSMTPKRGCQRETSFEELVAEKANTKNEVAEDAVAQPADTVGDDGGSSGCSPQLAAEDVSGNKAQESNKNAIGTGEEVSAERRKTTNTIETEEADLRAIAATESHFSLSISPEKGEKCDVQSTSRQSIVSPRQTESPNSEKGDSSGSSEKENTPLNINGQGKVAKLRSMKPKEPDSSKGDSSWSFTELFPSAYNKRLQDKISTPVSLGDPNIKEMVAEKASTGDEDGEDDVAQPGDAVGGPQLVSENVAVDKTVNANGQGELVKRRSTKPKEPDSSKGDPVRSITELFASSAKKRPRDEISVLFSSGGSYVGVPEKYVSSADRRDDTRSEVPGGSAHSPRPSISDAPDKLETFIEEKIRQPYEVIATGEERSGHPRIMNEATSRDESSLLQHLEMNEGANAEPFTRTRKNRGAASLSFALSQTPSADDSRTSERTSTLKKRTNPLPTRQNRGAASLNFTLSQTPSTDDSRTSERTSTLKKHVNPLTVRQSNCKNISVPFSITDCSVHEPIQGHPQALAVGTANAITDDPENDIVDDDESAVQMNENEKGNRPEPFRCTRRTNRDITLDFTMSQTPSANDSGASERTSALKKHADPLPTRHRNRNSSSIPFSITNSCAQEQSQSQPGALAVEATDAIAGDPQNVIMDECKLASSDPTTDPQLPSQESERSSVSTKSFNGIIAQDKKGNCNEPFRRTRRTNRDISLDFTLSQTPSANDSGASERTSALKKHADPLPTRHRNCNNTSVPFSITNSCAQEQSQSQPGALAVEATDAIAGDPQNVDEDKLASSDPTTDPPLPSHESERSSVSTKSFNGIIAQDMKGNCDEPFRRTRRTNRDISLDFTLSQTPSGDDSETSERTSALKMHSNPFPKRRSNRNKFSIPFSISTSSVEELERTSTITDDPENIIINENLTHTDTSTNSGLTIQGAELASSKTVSSTIPSQSSAQSSELDLQVSNSCETADPLKLSLECSLSDLSGLSQGSSSRKTSKFYDALSSVSSFSNVEPSAAHSNLMEHLRDMPVSEEVRIEGEATVRDIEANSSIGASPKETTSGTILPEMSYLLEKDAKVFQPVAAGNGECQPAEAIAGDCQPVYDEGMNPPLVVDYQNLQLVATARESPIASDIQESHVDQEPQPAAVGADPPVGAGSQESQPTEAGAKEMLHVASVTQKPTAGPQEPVSQPLVDVDQESQHVVTALEFEIVVNQEPAAKEASLWTSAKEPDAKEIPISTARAQEPAGKEVPIPAAGAQEPSAEEIPNPTIGAEEPARKEIPIPTAGAKEPAAKEIPITAAGTQKPAAKEILIPVAGAEEPADKEISIPVAGAQEPAPKELPVPAAGAEESAAREIPIPAASAQEPATKEIPVPAAGAQGPVAQEPPLRGIQEPQLFSAAAKDSQPITLEAHVPVPASTSLPVIAKIVTTHDQIMSSALMPPVLPATPLPNLRKSKRKSVTFKHPSHNLYHSPPELLRLDEEGQEPLATTSKPQNFDEFSRIQMTVDMSEIETTKRATRSNKHASSTPLPNSKKRCHRNANLSGMVDEDLRREPNVQDENLMPAPPAEAGDDNLFLVPRPQIGTKQVSQQELAISPLEPAVPSVAPPKRNCSSESEKSSVDLSCEKSPNISAIPKDTSGPKWGNVFHSTPLRRTKSSVGKKSKKQRTEEGNQEAVGGANREARLEPETVNHSVQTTRVLRSRSRSSSGAGYSSTSSSRSSSKSSRRDKSRSNEEAQQEEERSPPGIAINDITVLSSRMASSKRSSRSRVSSYISYDSHRKLASRLFLDEVAKKNVSEHSNVASNVPDDGMSVVESNDPDDRMSVVEGLDPDDKMSDVESNAADEGMSAVESDVGEESDAESVSSIRSLPESSHSNASSSRRFESFASSVGALRRSLQEPSILKGTCDKCNCKCKACGNTGQVKPTAKSDFSLLFEKPKRKRRLPPVNENEAWARKRPKIFKPKWSKKIYKWLEPKFKPTHGLSTTLIVESFVIDLNAAMLFASSGRRDEALSRIRGPIKDLGIATNEIQFWSFIRRFTTHKFKMALLPMGCAFGTPSYPRINPYDPI